MLTQNEVRSNASLSFYKKIINSFKTLVLTGSTSSSNKYADSVCVAHRSLVVVLLNTYVINAILRLFMSVACEMQALVIKHIPLYLPCLLTHFRPRNATIGN